MCRPVGERHLLYILIAVHANFINKFSMHICILLCTVNWEIFVYENIRVFNVHVNKILWVPHENILT